MERERIYTKNHARIGLLTMLGALAGCSALVLENPLRVAGGDWTTEGGSAARTFATAEALEPPLVEAWDYNAEGAFGPSGALVADGVLLIPTRKGEIHTVRLDDGRRLGSVGLGEALEGAPVLTERVLYAPVAGGKHTLIAYDFTAGRREWELRAGPISAGLLRTGDAIVAAGEDGTVRSVGMREGEERWRVTPDTLAGFFASPTALGPDLLAVADDLGRVSALDAATGTTRWTTALGRPVYATPAAGEGLLLVPTSRGLLAALETETGAVRWTYAAPDSLAKLATPALADGLVFVGGTDGRLRALEAATGREVWSFRTDGVLAAAPLVAGPVVYVGAMDETLYALDRETGAVRWQAELPGRAKSAPVLRNGVLVVLAEPRHAVAFRAADAVAAARTAPD